MLASHTLRPMLLLVSMAMAKINQAAATDAAVDMSELLHTFANDMACRIVSGKFFLKDGRSKLFLELIKDTSRLLGGFNLEYFPTVGRVGVLKKRFVPRPKE